MTRSVEDWSPWELGRGKLQEGSCRVRREVAGSQTRQPETKYVGYTVVSVMLGSERGCPKGRKVRTSSLLSSCG